MTVGGKITCTY